MNGLSFKQDGVFATFQQAQKANFVPDIILGQAASGEDETQRWPGLSLAAQHTGLSLAQSPGVGSEISASLMLYQSGPHMDRMSAQDTKCTSGAQRVVLWSWPPSAAERKCVLSCLVVIMPSRGRDENREHRQLPSLYTHVNIHTSACTVQI